MVRLFSTRRRRRVDRLFDFSFSMLARRNKINVNSSHVQSAQNERNRGACFICVVLADAQEIMDEFVQESKYHKTSRIFINLKSSRNVKRNILIGVDKKRKK